MDDIRDTRPWFWILFFVVFAIAAAGLVIAISANNNSVDEKKVVKEATAEVEEELAGLHGALQAANEFQQESDKVARRDRIRIKRAVAEAVEGSRRKLKKLNGRVAALETGQGELRGQDAELRKSVAAVVQDVETLEAEASAINRKIRQLNANGGT